MNFKEHVLDFPCKVNLFKKCPPPPPPWEIQILTPDCSLLIFFSGSPLGRGRGRRRAVAVSLPALWPLFLLFSALFQLYQF